MRFAPLPRSFYEPSAQVVAVNLIGHFLIHITPDGICGGPIVETEAYLEGDPACHAACGLTPRNRVMFGPPGHAYVYFIYGAHYCVNAVCQPTGQAEAVLIRAIEPAIGIGILQNKRPCVSLRGLTNGPAKLCEAMAIDRTLDGADLCDPASALFIARSAEIKSFVARYGPLVATPRIGITRAAERPLRFLLEGNEFVSRPNRK